MPDRLRFLGNTNLYLCNYSAKESGVSPSTLYELRRVITRRHLRRVLSKDKYIVEFPLKRRRKSGEALAKAEDCPSTHTFALLQCSFVVAIVIITSKPWRNNSRKIQKPVRLRLCSASASLGQPSPCLAMSISSSNGFPLKKWR